MYLQNSDYTSNLKNAVFCPKSALFSACVVTKSNYLTCESHLWSPQVHVPGGRELGGTNPVRQQACKRTLTMQDNHTSSWENAQSRQQEQLQQQRTSRRKYISKTTIAAPTTQKEQKEKLLVIGRAEKQEP